MEYQRSKDAIDKLTPEQFRITQRAVTLRPFTGVYNDHN